jgi:hypothetical protein
VFKTTPKTRPAFSFKYKKAHPAAFHIESQPMCLQLADLLFCPLRRKSYFLGFFTGVPNKDNLIRPVYLVGIVRNKKCTWGNDQPFTLPSTFITIPNFHIIPPNKKSIIILLRFPISFERSFLKGF